MTTLLDLDRDDLFKFRYDEDTIYKFIDFNDDEQKAYVQRVLSRSSEKEEWGPVALAHVENANPYADVKKVRVCIKVTKGEKDASEAIGN